MASEAKLHETGCCLCGADDPGNTMGSQRANPGARVCFGCLPRDNDSDALLKAWDAADAEITRRKSLAQPSAERGPRVGETWERGDGQVVTLEAARKCGCFRCSRGYFALSPSCEDEHIKKGEFRLIRRLSAPSADKWEPKRGDFVRIVNACGSPLTQGDAYRVEGATRRSDGNSFALLVLGQPHAWAVLIEPATPSPKAEDEWDCLACGAKCGDHPDQCGICGTVRGHTKMRGAAPAGPKLDPDGYLNREALDEQRRSERLDFGARRLAAVQAHKLDLDRKIPTVRGRLAAEVKAALRTWPEAEDD